MHIPARVRLGKLYIWIKKLSCLDHRLDWLLSNYRFCCICQLALSLSLLAFEIAENFDRGLARSLAIRFCCRSCWDFCIFHKLLHLLQTWDLSLRTMASQDLLIYLKNNSFDSSHQNEQHYLLILFLLKIDQTCWKLVKSVATSSKKTDL